MAWIEIPPPGQATGLLRRIYDEAVKRAGRVYNIVSIQSRRPRVLQASMQLYQELMLSPRSDLSRARREMLATAVSQANRCHY